MALINCIECGNEISDKAHSCPHCGCPASLSISSKDVEVLTANTAVEDQYNSSFNVSSDTSDNSGCLSILGVFIAIVIVLFVLICIFKGIRFLSIGGILIPISAIYVICLALSKMKK